MSRRDSATLDLAADVEAPRRARRFVRDTLRCWGWPEPDDAVLLASEAVSDAVEESDTPTLAVTVRRQDDGSARVEVHDHDNAGPDEKHQGIRVIAEVAADWGVERFENDGKALWFVVTRPR
jgi:hypothetical protein